MQITVRKLVRQLVETQRENGQALDRPHRVAVVAAVVENPWPSGFVADLLPGLDEAAEELGTIIGPATVELLGEDVEAFGKAALVGIDGEVEHGSALIHNLRFGNVFRNAAGGTELLPAAEKVGFDRRPDRHRPQAQARLEDPLAPPDVHVLGRRRAAATRDPRALRSHQSGTSPRPPRDVRGRGRRDSRCRGGAVTALDTTGTSMDIDDPSWISAAHLEYTITSWSTQSNVKPLPIAGGEGSWFWDYDGKRYLDFQSQLVNLNLGHQHPRLVDAIKRQADRLCYIGPSMGNDMRSELGALIAEVTPGDLKSTFFTTGGAAAIENAIRLARHFTGRSKIITRYRSYHGATAGAISLTGDPRRWGS